MASTSFLNGTVNTDNIDVEFEDKKRTTFKDTEFLYQIHSSKFYNEDLAPVPSDKRNWTTYNFAALWISMAHCIPTYMLAGSLIAVGMNWWQSLLTILLGNLIVLVPILFNAHPGTKYGIPFPILARSSFGMLGANIPTIIRAIVACGWFGIQTFIGGEAIKTFMQTLWPQFGQIGDGFAILGLSIPSMITFFIFWGMQIFIIYRGMETVRKFENWAAPIVLVMALALLIYVVIKAGGLGPIFSNDSNFNTFGDFWVVFMPSLTAMIGSWATLSLNIPDFTRYGRSQKEQMIGQTLGLPTTMVAFSAIGVIITSASKAIMPEVEISKLWDPVFILSQLTSDKPPPGLTEPLISSQATRIIVAILALLGVMIATISVNVAANIVSSANDFSNLSPRRISFKTGGLITGIIGILIMPWKILSSADSYILNWLVGYSGLLGPIAGIMIVDYWILKKQKLEIIDLYKEDGSTYKNYYFPPIIALALGILPNLPGLIRSVFGLIVEKNFFDYIYPYAWFTGFIISSLIHWQMSLYQRRKNYEINYSRGMLEDDQTNHERINAETLAKKQEEQRFCITE